MSNRSRTSQTRDPAGLSSRLSESNRRTQQRRDGQQSPAAASPPALAGRDPSVSSADGQVSLPLEQVQLNRLFLLGEMAAGLAHQLNQPLAVIATYSRACLRMLQSGAADLDVVRRSLEHVANQAEHAGEFVHHLHQFLAHGTPRRAVANLNELVRDVVSLCEPELKAENIALELLLAERLSPVNVDRAQIEQVLLNLIHNAVDALRSSPRGQRRLTLTTMTRGDAVEVSVRDTGPGLPEDMIQNLFQPFRTTKTHGLGLGLTISRSLIEAHQGRLWAKPNRDRGTTFTFLLPSELSTQHDKNAADSLPGR